MKNYASVFCVLAMVGQLWANDGEIMAWRGAALGGWKAGQHCSDVRVEGESLRGRITGRDSQLNAKVASPFLSKGNQVVYLKARVDCGGRGQLFWMRDCDRNATEAQQCRIPFVGDGAWHTYRLRPGWGGTNRISRLRLDFPSEATGTTFEVSSIVVCAEGKEISFEAKEKSGVSFSLQMPLGHHYCSIIWSGDSGRPGMFSFMPATDGRRHTYWFDLRNARVTAWGKLRGQPSWLGHIYRLEVEQVHYDRLLPVENLTICAAKPDLPADVSILSATAGEAIPRAGRDFPLEIVLRNFGTRASERIELSFDGLPAGARLLDGESAALASLPGSVGLDTLSHDCAPQLVSERVLRPRFSDLGVGRHKLGVSLSVGGKLVQRVETTVEVKPSLGLAKADYPPPPQKVDTAPYEIGAFLFPGWTVHKWHAVWSHAPWRKPLLGWYDETKPETIDWQIKHLVENGVSFVSVDWYWSRERLGMHHWMDAFAKARYRKFLKWHVMWANHNSADSHYVADQEKVTRYWIDNYFCDPQYQRIDGMPVVTIWSPDNMERDMAGKGGCRALLEISQRLARAAGYKGIYFMAVRGPDREDAAFLKTFADKGFRRTCVYKYMGGIPGAPIGEGGSRPYSFIADTSLGHWRALAKNGTVPFMPSLSTAWDDRPWRGEIGWEISNINAKDFRRICADARKFSDESGERMLLMGPLDEWGEGSIGYPNAEHGFGMLEAVRDTFAHPSAAGWPVNHGPEDIGIACPQTGDAYEPPRVKLGNEVSDGRPNVRWRGFNLLEMFYKGRNSKPMEFREEDFQIIHDWGFNFVRLPMDYRFWIKDGDWGQFDEDALKCVDRAIALGRKYGVHVLINMHRCPGYTVARPREERDLFTDAEAQRVCAKHWAMFARRYRGIPNDVLSFNLFNEPPSTTDEAYGCVARLLVDAIRAEDPTRFIIADGLAWGREPVPSLYGCRGVGQATRGYTPMSVSHYLASWVGTPSADPAWPIPSMSPIGTMGGPSKKAEGMFEPFTLANVPAGTLTVEYGRVSGPVTITFETDGILAKSISLVPSCESPLWTGAKKYPQWNNVIQANYNGRDTFTFSKPVNSFVIRIVKGDWAVISSIRLTSADGSRTALLPFASGWGKPQHFAQRFVGWGKVAFRAADVASSSMAYVDQGQQFLYDMALSQWDKPIHRGEFVFCGEFGVYMKTPHAIVLDILEDYLRLWKERNMGWSLWNLRGSFGVLDSGRKDVVYEDFRGHKLDRKMLELLQRY